jgi:hypothetical protein
MIRLVTVLLMAWEPLRFAGEALQVLPSIGYRGVAAGIELLAHGAAAVLSMAAGVALWNASPDARRLATVAIIVLIARSVQSLYWSVLPNNTRPGEELFTAGVALLSGALMLAAIRWRAA